MKAIPVGTRIICPNKMCEAALFEFTRQVDLGESLNLDQLHPLRNDSVKSAESCCCPACGKQYYSNGAVHTHFGWYPYQP